jgi:hypothetical protein
MFNLFYISGFALIAFMLITWQLSKLPACSGLREGAAWVGYGLLVVGYAFSLMIGFC